MSVVQISVVQSSAELLLLAPVTVVLLDVVTVQSGVVVSVVHVSVVQSPAELVVLVT